MDTLFNLYNNGVTRSVQCIVNNMLPWLSWQSGRLTEGPRFRVGAYKNFFYTRIFTPRKAYLNGHLVMYRTTKARVAHIGLISQRSQVRSLS